MAVKKITKTKAKEAVEIKTIDNLRADLQSKQTDLIEAKRGHRQGELVNTCVLKSTRREIARINTAINATKAANMLIKQKGEDK